MLSIALVLFIIGLMLGSFVNATVWRIKQQALAKSAKAKAKKGKTKAQSSSNLSILYGRSICPNCRHQLAWYDLIPIFSWLYLRGKCRYCSRPISAQYPIVELISGLIFLTSYVFWPTDVHTGGQWLLLATWLISSVGLLALAVYDLKWMLLPNRIIYPTLAVAAAGRAAYIALYASRPLHELFMWILSVMVASGVFFALFYASGGKWIGYGDVRLGLITGTLLADPQKSLAMIFFASVIGCLCILPALLSGKKTLASRLPFGPFLIIATAILVVFGDSLLNWYKGLIL